MFCGQCGTPVRAAEERAPRVWRWGLLALGAVLVLLGGATAGVYLAGHRPFPAPAQVGGRPAAESAAAAHAAASTAAPTAAPTVAPTEAPTPAVPNLAADRAAVLSAIDSHWDAIRAHDFETAYRYLAPNTAGGEASWVSAHQQDGIVDVRYDFAVDQVTGDTATVEILTLQTVAQGDQTSANPAGCLNWTGTCTLTRVGDRWLISRAALNSAPC